MKSVEDMGHDDLVQIVRAVRDLLYLNDRVYDPDRDWDRADICMELSGHLQAHGLVPEFVGDESNLRCSLS